jgi:lipopolysaccharide biosynthesis protein
MANDFWDVIIEKYRCPAVKVELLRDNPLGIDISSALEFLAEKTTYDVSLIRAHLRRIKGAASGHRPRTAAAGARAVAG